MNSSHRISLILEVSAISIPGKGTINAESGIWHYISQIQQTNAHIKTKEKRGHECNSPYLHLLFSQEII